MENFGGHLIKLRNMIRKIKQWIEYNILGLKPKVIICNNCEKNLNNKCKSYYKGFTFCNLDCGMQFFKDCIRTLKKVKEDL